MKRIWFGFVLALFAVPNHALAAKGLCGFDSSKLSFKGTALEQASCLLRFVKKKAAGSDVQPIPTVISERVGKAVDMTADQFKTCIAHLGVAADDIGGAIATGSSASRRTYFVIHDTSSPELAAPASFPADINDKSWSGNQIATGWTSLKGRVNVLINRAGDSRTMTDFAVDRSRPAVKLEQTSQVFASRPVFLHVENIQPRIKPNHSWGHIAPDPGFSDAQLQRLALVYVAASVRARHWLIPAFHFNIDSDLYPGVDVHDDPQAFDLMKWGTKIEDVIKECTP